MAMRWWQTNKTHQNTHIPAQTPNKYIANFHFIIFAVLRDHTRLQRRSIDACVCLYITCAWFTPALYIYYVCVCVWCDTLTSGVVYIRHHQVIAGQLRRSATLAQHPHHIVSITIVVQTITERVVACSPKREIYIYYKNDMSPTTTNNIYSLLMGLLLYFFTRTHRDWWRRLEIYIWECMELRHPINRYRQRTFIQWKNCECHVYIYI